MDRGGPRVDILLSKQRSNERKPPLREPSRDSFPARRSASSPAHFAEVQLDYCGAPCSPSGRWRHRVSSLSTAGLWFGLCGGCERLLGLDEALISLLLNSSGDSAFSLVLSCSVSASAFYNFYPPQSIFSFFIFSIGVCVFLRVCCQLTEALIAPQASAVKPVNGGDLRDRVYLGFTCDSKQPSTLTLNFL